MEALVAEADTHLLASLALGHSCFVVDYASRNKKRGTSRALWYGCTFISFACETVWFGAPSQTPVLRGYNVQTDFTDKLARFDKRTLQRLRYFRRFVPPSVNGCVVPRVRLYGLCAATERDADKSFHEGLMLQFAAAPSWSGQDDRDDDARAALDEAIPGGLDRLSLLSGLKLWTGELGHREYAALQAERARDAVWLDDDDTAEAQASSEAVMTRSEEAIID
jgi:hypothetical protein